MNETSTPTPRAAAAAAPSAAPASPATPQVTPHVLALVVRLERAAPPARTDAMETAARAVLTLLTDPRTTGPADEAQEGAETQDRAETQEGAEVQDGAEAPGAWADAVAQWEDVHGGGIRKVVRRARGAEWRRAQALPGVTVTGRTAEVRAFPPVPLDGWPKDLAKLQVSGTELDDPEPPEAPDEGVPVLWLSPDLEMSAGKAMAQAGHGAQLAWWRLTGEARAAWRAAGFPLAVRTAPTAAAWESLTTSGLPVVRDAGFTEIAPGSCTVVADHPALRRQLG